MMIKIILVDKAQKEIKQIEVEPSKIVDAACIVHEGRYFIYSGMEGRAFSTVRFCEVNPPVEV